MLACRLWSAKIGQDFIPQCNLLGIDYCSIHLWPDNWNTYDASFPTTWITAHEAATRSLNKPLVLEEVNCHVSVLQVQVWQAAPQRMASKPSAIHSNNRAGPQRMVSKCSVINPISTSTMA